ncbi:MAG: thymidylate kinase [Candidatus Sungbacteria bacterium]|nr:thymidylate kinase [Candidatus Sungbacteria bacterium]
MTRLQKSLDNLGKGEKSMERGQLFVLEGTDGSGKGTQFKLLLTRLRRLRCLVETLSFPQYGTKSAGLIEEYLNGKYGADPTDVSPYVASLFYALDRFDAATKIRTWLTERKIVLLDRYVDSNAGHQGGKIQDLAKRKNFLHWLYRTEYHILGVPKPDIVFILHVPASIGQRLVAQKSERGYLGGATHDIHEADLQHLKDAEQSYLWLARTYPKDHCVIECVEDGRLLSPAQIHEKIWVVLEQYLRYEAISRFNARNHGPWR